MKTLGQIAYEASGFYLHSEYNENHDPWDCQLPGTKGHWQAAALAVRDQVIEQCIKVAESLRDESADCVEAAESEGSGLVHTGAAMRAAAIVDRLKAMKATPDGA